MATNTTATATSAALAPATTSNPRTGAPTTTPAPHVPNVLAGVVATTPAPATTKATATRKAASKPTTTKATKAAPAPRKAAATKAAPKATPVARTTSAGSKLAKAMAWLQRHPGAHAVKDIEIGCGYPFNTLAGVLARYAASQGATVVRAQATVAGSTRPYKGFAYKAPKATKATAPKASTTK